METRQGLGCQSDFRHQNQHLPAAFQHRRNAAKIDLGFAAACDAFEQENFKLIKGSGNVGDRLSLSVGGCWRCFGVQRECCHCVFDRTVLRQRAQGVAAKTGSHQILAGNRGVITNVVEQCLLDWCPFAGQLCHRGLPQVIGHDIAVRALARGGGQNGSQHLAEWVVIIAGHPVRQTHQIGGQYRRVVENAFDGLEFFVAAGHLGGHADTNGFAAPERYFDAAADLGNRQVFGSQIVIYRVQRAGYRDLDDAFLVVRKGGPRIRNQWRSCEDMAVLWIRAYSNAKTSRDE